ncbi:MAG: hypothetical protein KAJ18_06405 [Candidatus Omnitrophica bacterium]|nr:hypothetical protein [Candidatus Omnitrophota bacterium]
MSETNGSEITDIQKYKDESAKIKDFVIIEKDEDVPILIAEDKKIGKKITAFKEWIMKHKKNAKKTYDDLLADEKLVINPMQDRRDLIQSEVSKYELKKEEDMKAIEAAKLKDADREEIDRRNELREDVKRFEASGDLAQANLAREQIKTVIADPVIIEDNNKVVETVSGNLSKKHDYDVFILDKKEAIQTIMDGKGPINAITVNEKAMKKFMVLNEFDPKKDTAPIGFRVVPKIKY